MSLAELHQMPVAKLAADNSVLWLWTTNAFLRDSFGLCQAWGFQYRTLLTWAKNRIGLGDWLRGQTEHCLFASRGQPVVTLHNESTLLRANVREHSQKPDEFFELVERLCPAPNMGRVELFARQARKGWRAWGAPAK
jgi:N6-adenosine-specific RNA methylase IME4